MKMKKFIYILPLLVVLFFQRENLKMIPSQEKPKLKIVDTIKKDTIKPVERLEMYHKSAHASYYANKFNGRRTASGKKFNNNDMTCAHRKLPFGTKLKVTGVKTKKVVYVTVTDRGPFVKTKHIDLTRKAFMEVAPKSFGGHIEVDIEVVKK
jgi:rare lipoprotein A